MDVVVDATGGPLARGAVGRGSRTRWALLILAAGAWLLAAAAAVATARAGNLADRWAAAPAVEMVMAPVVFGLVHALVIVSGEVVARRRLGQLRQAPLVRPGGLALADGWVLRLGGVGLLLLLGTVVAGAALADADGETFGHGNPGAYPLAVSHLTVGVFPGPRYGVTLLLAAALLVVAAVGAVWSVARRPARGAAEVDRWMRRLAVHRVLRGCAAAMLLLGSTAGLLAAVAVAEAFPGGPVRGAGAVVAGACAVLALSAPLVSLAPGPRYPQQGGADGGLS